MFRGKLLFVLVIVLSLSGCATNDGGYIGCINNVQSNSFSYYDYDGIESGKYKAEALLALVGCGVKSFVDSRKPYEYNKIEPTQKDNMPDGMECMADVDCQDGQSCRSKVGGGTVCRE